MNEMEFSDGELNSPADREMAMALQSLTPSPARLDAISAAVSAGRRIERRRTRLGLGTSALAAVLCVAIWFDAGNHAVPPTQSPPQWTTSAKTVIEPLSEESVARLQAAVELHGLDGLPPLDRPADKPVHVSDFF
jgi:hypothetical protein